jgi:hypothetical protein
MRQDDLEFKDNLGYIVKTLPLKKKKKKLLRRRDEKDLSCRQPWEKVTKTLTPTKQVRSEALSPRPAWAPDPI